MKINGVHYNGRFYKGKSFDDFFKNEGHHFKGDKAAAQESFDLLQKAINEKKSETPAPPEEEE